MEKKLSLGACMYCMGLPGGSVVKANCKYRKHGFDTRVAKIAWRRKWQPTLVFLPGKSIYRKAWWATLKGVAKSWTRLSD